MEFKVEKKDSPHSRKYSKQDMDIAREFAKKVYKEFGVFVKAIAIFGSSAKAVASGTEKIVETDIDILVIVDDLVTTLSGEVVETYRVIMEKLITETSKRIHLTTLRYTNFWEYVRNGDPIAINILRDGVSLIDNGFFDPLQALLYQGRIRATWESIWTYYSRAPTTIFNAKWHIMQAVLDLYWAVIDSAHAALMKLGEIPPSPNHVADLIEEKMVKKGIVEKRYASIMRDFYHLSKSIIHRDIKQIHGADFDRYLKDAEDFVSQMRLIIEKKDK